MLEYSCAGARGGSLLRAGCVWHKKDPEAGAIPHFSIGPKTAGEKSRQYGWVPGPILELCRT